MIASTRYNDLVGTAAADITDIGTSYNTLEDLSKKIKLDESKLKLVGLTFDEFDKIDKITVKLICIDILRSTSGKKCLVTVSLPETINATLHNFLKRISVTLYSKYDHESPSLERCAEKHLSEYMEEE
jgi:thiamine pyrophosphate-dependent acetolactate synthase large subunit-like protein